MNHLLTISEFKYFELFNSDLLASGMTSGQLLLSRADSVRLTKCLKRISYILKY